MASGSKRRPTGRVTPKGGGNRPPAKRAPDRPEAPPPQVGRRPSNPRFLAVVGLLWILAGIAVLFRVHTAWRIVPAVFAIGVGLFFVRGAAATVLRRQGR